MRKNPTPAAHAPTIAIADTVQPCVVVQQMICKIIPKANVIGLVGWVRVRISQHPPARRTSRAHNDRSLLPAASEWRRGLNVARRTQARAVNA